MAGFGFFPPGAAGAVAVDRSLLSQDAKRCAVFSSSLFKCSVPFLRGSRALNVQISPVFFFYIKLLTVLMVQCHRAARQLITIIPTTTVCSFSLSLSLSLSSLYYDIAQLSTDYVELQMNDSW